MGRDKAVALAPPNGAPAYQCGACTRFAIARTPAAAASVTSAMFL
jgi:hypothetical protein